MLDISAISSILSQLNSLNSSNRCVERVQVTILKTSSSQMLPDFGEAASEFEKRANLKMSDLVKCRSTQAALTLEYEVSPEKLEKILTCVPRLKLGDDVYKLYTKLLEFYRLQVSGTHEMHSKIMI
jgi:hypothetical protein